MEKIILLDAKFRKIGFAIIFISIAFSIVSKFIVEAAQLSELSTEILFNSFFGLLNLGLFFIFYAKRPTDDEMTVQMKLKATKISVLFVTLMFIVKPLVDLVFGDPKPITATYLLLLLQGMQISVYYLEKRKLSKELQKDEE